MKNFIINEIFVFFCECYSYINIMWKVNTYISVDIKKQNYIYIYLF